MLWSFLAAVGVSFMGVKRPKDGKRLETLAFSFVIAMILNSCAHAPPQPWPATWLRTEPRRADVQTT